MEERLLDIASRFELEGKIADIRPLGEGFINDTYIITTEGKTPDYILQRKNHLIFPDVPGMMENIKADPAGSASLLSVSLMNVYLAFCSIMIRL